MSPLDQFRAQKDDFFRHDWQSPLTPDQRQDFSGLEVLPGESRAASHQPDRAISPIKETVTMITSTGSAREYVKYGQLLI